VIEEADQDRWLTLPTTQIPVQLIAELTRRSRTSPTRGVRLDIVVQQFNGVQFWAVAGQEVQLDAVGMAPNPGADQLGPVYRMPIHDQVDLSLAAIP
jgi:hypothetical protein